MTAEKLKEYARLKFEEKQIQTRLKELNPEIVAEMEADGLDKQPTSLGTFLLAVKKKWTFSPAHEAMTNRLEDIESKEKADGTAKFEESKYLIFKEPK